MPLFSFSVGFDSGALSAFGCLCLGLEGFGGFGGFGLFFFWDLVVLSWSVLLVFVRCLVVLVLVWFGCFRFGVFVLVGVGGCWVICCFGRCRLGGLVLVVLVWFWCGFGGCFGGLFFFH